MDTYLLKNQQLNFIIRSNTHVTKLRLITISTINFLINVYYCTLLSLR